MRSLTGLRVSCFAMPGLSAAIILVAMTAGAFAQQNGQIKANIPADAFNAALAAGEYSVAEKLIDDLAGDNGDQRIDLTRQLARAQHASGASRQAELTLLRNHLRIQLSSSQQSANYDRESEQAWAYDSQMKPEIDISSTSGNSISGNPGGGSVADFGSLITLIQSTIAPDSWGLESTIIPYPGGVYVDPSGAMRRVVADSKFNAAALNLIQSRNSSADWQSTTELRHVSLTRLNMAIADRVNAGFQPTEAMRCMSGLNRIDYVYWHPESGELIIAGPAGNISDGRFRYKVDSESGRAVVLLEDIATVLVSLLNRESAFGVSLAPSADGLSRIKAMLGSPAEMKEFARRPGPWTDKLASTLGAQEVEIFGLQPNSSTALALLEADEHMKRLGLGLADPVRGVSSYPDTVEKLQLEFDGRMIRWWFSASDELILTNSDKNVYKIPERSVQLLTEDQWMNATGQRSGTGQVDIAAQTFAQQFTKEFSDVAIQYPFYQRLKHIFDAATALELARQSSPYSNLQPLYFEHILKWGELQNSNVSEPLASDTIATWRRIGKNRLIAMVSGGVRVPFREFEIAEGASADNAGKVDIISNVASPELTNFDQWWWNDPAPGQ